LPDAPPSPDATLQPLTPEEEATLSEDVDLEADFRRHVLVTFRSLNELDHYGLLRVDRTADRKALKRSYYDLAARFHPDRYFRKKLGSFKSRMESIFGRITLAHDTLTDRERRAEYDAYLEEQRRSRGIEDLLAAALAEAKTAEERIEKEAREQAKQETRNAAPAQPALPTSPTGAAVARPTPPAQPSPIVEAAARRDALARRLLGGRAPSTSTAPSSATGGPPGGSGNANATRPRPSASAQTPGGGTPPHPTGAGGAPPQTTSEAMDALRRRYEERVRQAKTAQARKYVKNGEEALASGDAVAAANAFRVALTLSPENEELQRAAQEAQQRADAILGETYARQGGYEEKNGQWAEAARSWARVVKARPRDASAFERAANAILKSEGNLHEASRLAQQACALDPTSAACRLTLGGVYLAAGLPNNARRELETAAQLAPHDGTIQAMLRRVGKE
jgi:curved DNA-binding protein CbpA/predicted TPR repeat methyltransferase